MQYDYTFDKALIREYQNLLGNWFLGLQLHESGSSFRGLAWAKVRELTGHNGPYTMAELEEKVKIPSNIAPDGKEAYTYYNLDQTNYTFFEGKTFPEDYSAFIETLKDLYRVRLEEAEGSIVPCDSYFIASDLQNDIGMKTFMPEVGCQIPRMRIEVAAARGTARMGGKTWGLYYKCWRPRPGQGATLCCFNDASMNEWYAVQEKSVDDFSSFGANGGSSRLLQNRIYYYSLMSGAHYMSEEWGLNSSYSDMNEFTLSPYGEVKKDFINTALDFRGMDAKTPFAIVMPKKYAVIEITGTLLDLKAQDRQIGDHRTEYLETPINDEDKAYFGHIEDVLRLFFTRYGLISGNEGHVMTNSRVGDLFDIIYEDAPEEAFERYEYLIDATAEGTFAKAKAVSGLKILKSDDLDRLCNEVNTLAKEIMPCFVDSLHWLVSTDEKGQNYLSIFNNEGNERSLEVGDIIDSKADKRVTVTFKNEVNLDLVKSSLGSCTVIGGKKVDVTKIDDKTYSVMIPAAGFAIFKF